MTRLDDQAGTGTARAGAEDSVTQPTPLEFLQLLNAGQVAGNGYIEFRFLRSGAKWWMPWPCFPEHPEVFTLDKTPAGQQVYFGVALRKDNSSGEAINCKKTSKLWADLDLKDFPEITAGKTKKELQKAPAAELKFYAQQLLAHTLNLCAAHQLPPRAAVYSGHGIQLYWVREVATDQEDTERFNRSLAHLLGGDLAVCDLARVLRIPGADNTKNPERPLRVTLEYSDSLAIVTDEALRALPLAEKDQPKPAAPAPKPVVAAPVATGDRVADTRRKYALEGIAREAAELAAMPEDSGRNNKLNESLYVGFTRVAGGHLVESDLDTLLQAARDAALPEGEIETTRKSARKGLTSPDDLARVGLDLLRPGLRVGKAAALPEGVELPTADEIPQPEQPADDKGKMDYSDAQVLTLLGLDSWKVVSPHSEQAHAIRLKRLAGPDLMYVPGKDGREWHVWNGRHWRDGAGAVAMAKSYTNRLSAALLPEAAQLEGLAGLLYAAGRQEDGAAMNRATRRHIRAAKAVEENKRQRAVLDLSTVHFLAAQEAHEIFALRPWVLGFQNGTLDGDTFREHRREDYMLSLLPVAYSESWEDGEWVELLGRMTGGDVELARMLQDVAAYILSGSSSQRVVFLAYGPQQSGKSTFAGLLETVLGVQANTIEPKHLSGESQRGLMGARLWNVRLGVCHEAGSVPINSELVKTMSGGDNYTVKHMYKNEFDAAPTHALLLVANDAPSLNGLDAALRDRVVALPFEYDLDPDDRRDLFGGVELKEVRRDPTSALVREFTAWAAEGMRRMFKTRTIYRAPASVLATAKLWEEVGDEMAEFWETIRTAEISLGVNVRELRNRYQVWCGEKNVKALAPRKWSQACVSVGLEKKNNGKEWVWQWSRPGRPWPFDSFDSFDNSVESLPREKTEGAAEATGDKGIPLGKVVKETVKTVKLSNDDLPAAVGDWEDER